MELTPSETVRFDSWKQLLKWLPEADESQLITTFVWAGEQKNVPPQEAARLKQVRSEAFELLVGRTRDALKRFLIKRHNCRDVHLAEDVVQEVHLQVFRRAEQFDPERSFWGWLYSIAYHKYIDALRRIGSADKGVGWAGQDDALEEWLHRYTGKAPAPEAAVIAQERAERLEKAVARLPKTQRLIYQLKREGVKGKDIARQIRKSEAYVSQAYHEAVMVLQDWVED